MLLLSICRLLQGPVCLNVESSNTVRTFVYIRDHSDAQIDWGTRKPFCPFCYKLYVLYLQYLFSKGFRCLLPRDELFMIEIRGRAVSNTAWTIQVEVCTDRNFIALIAYAHNYEHLYHWSLYKVNKCLVNEYNEGNKITMFLRKMFQVVLSY